MPAAGAVRHLDLEGLHFLLGMGVEGGLIEEAHFVQLPGGNEHHFTPPSIVVHEAVIHTDFFHFTVQTTATGKGMVRFQSGLDAKQW